MASLIGSVDGTDGLAEPHLTPARRRLLEDTDNVVLATIGPHQQPQLTPNWFLWDGSVFLVSTAKTSVKVRNIRRNPRVTLCIDTLSPAAYVQVAGRAEIIEDEEERTLQLIAKYVEDTGVLAHWETIRDDHVMLRIEPRRWQWFETSA